MLGLFSLNNGWKEVKRILPSKIDLGVTSILSSCAATAVSLMGYRPVGIFVGLFAFSILNGGIICGQYIQRQIHLENALHRRMRVLMGEEYPSQLMKQTFKAG